MEKHNFVQMFVVSLTLGSRSEQTLLLSAFWVIYDSLVVVIASGNNFYFPYVIRIL